MDSSLSNNSTYRISQDEMNQIRRDAIEFAGIGLCRFLGSGTVLFADRNFLSILELNQDFESPEQVVGKTLEELVEPLQPTSRILELSRRHGCINDVVFPIRTRMGNQKWVLLDCYWVNDEANAEPALQVIVRDITDRKRAEDLIREQESQYRAVFNASADGLAIIDLDGLVVEANPALCEMHGYTREEVIGKDVSCFICDEYQTLVDSAMRRAKEGQEVDLLVGSVRRDGAELKVETRGAMVEYNGKPHLLMVVRDISERLRANEEKQRMLDQMEQAQRLEVLGVMAGGIAHQFNNLLMGILGHAELAVLELPEESPGYENMRQVERIAQRAAKLAHQMLAYSGHSNLQPQNINVSRLIHEMTHLLDASTSGRATIRYDLADNLPEVNGDAGQIGQVVMNVLINAAESLGPEGGTVKVRTVRIDADREMLSGTYVDDRLPEGPYVCLEISDSGCGMDQETLDRVFDPFFTTKFVGRGMGLAAVLGIVRGHKGAIQVDSTSGRGTTVQILLPALTPQKEHVQTELPVSEIEPIAKTVLLVDDEEPVRLVALKLIERAGYRAIAASGGQEAIDLLKEHGDSICCVLLDLTMPRMDGETTLNEIRKLREDVRVIFCSGYSQQQVAPRLIGRGMTVFLQKPYRLADLKQKLEEVLGD